MAPARSLVRVLIAALLLALAAAFVGAGPSTADPGPTPAKPAPTTSATPAAGATTKSYRVYGAATRAARNKIAGTGASIDSVTPKRVNISATRHELASVKRLGYTVKAETVRHHGRISAKDFATADSAYHNYAEMTDEVNALVAAHPDLAAKSSLGTSYEGRDMPIIKISDNVATDEAEPEVLYYSHMHAREHITVEMALYLLHLYLDNYGTDSRITNLVDSREIWIVPDMNPDGGEFDISTGTYKSWRKNRQPNAGTTNIGTDLNRNWGYQWGCCNGSSTSTASDTYRGPAAFSAPENVLLRNFINSRVVGGVQQIKTSISFHSYSQLVLWPYGYTAADTTANMTADQHNALAALGTQMAATNGYTPQQASDLYVVDGDASDWEWGTHKIFAYSFEMYPSSSQSSIGFYPPGSVIATETARNKEASLELAEYADCPYRVINKQAQYCGLPGPTTVYADNFETSTGWTTNPSGTDTATGGAWERGVPQATNSSGVKQLSTPVSGTNDLVTGRLAGSDAGAYDIDGGVTSISSPPIDLPATGTLTLNLSQYLAFGTNSSSADYLKVSVVSGGTTTTVFTRTGSTTNTNAAWATASANLTPYAGQTVKILVSAADASGASLVEAAVDDVSITRS